MLLNDDDDDEGLGREWASGFTFLLVSKSLVEDMACLPDCVQLFSFEPDLISYI